MLGTERAITKKLYRRHRCHQLNLTQHEHIHTSEIDFNVDEARSRIVTDTIRRRLFTPKGFLTTTQTKKRLKQVDE